MGLSKTSKWKLLAAIALISKSAMGAVLYNIVELQPLSGDTTISPRWINSLGQVVGVSGTGASQKAFVYSNGVTSQVLPTIGASYYGVAINDSGVIVGGYSGGIFINSGGVTSPVSVPAGPAGAIPIAFGLNNSGVVVGSTIGEGIARHAFRSEGGVSQDIGTLGQYSDARDVNASGTIAGTAFNVGGDSKVFVYDGSSSKAMTLPAGWFSGEGRGINDAGVILGIGIKIPNSNSRSFIIDNGVFTELPLLTTGNQRATDINNSGVVVGNYASGGSVLKAFVVLNGVTTDLTSLIDPSTGITLQSAVGINDLGQIIAVNSTQHAFLLTPVGLPEPGTLVGLGLGGAGLLLRRRRTGG